ncbi:hypothetical protein VTH06DRAFT_2271 [Thermothelomyces fergusii]
MPHGPDSDINLYGNVRQMATDVSALQSETAHVNDETQQTARKMKRQKDKKDTICHPLRHIIPHPKQL